MRDFHCVYLADHKLHLVIAVPVTVPFLSLFCCGGWAASFFVTGLLTR